MLVAASTYVVCMPADRLGIPWYVEVEGHHSCAGRVAQWSHANIVGRYRRMHNHEMQEGSDKQALAALLELTCAMNCAAVQRACDPVQCTIQRAFQLHRVMRLCCVARSSQDHTHGVCMCVCVCVCVCVCACVRACVTERASPDGVMARCQVNVKDKASVDNMIHLLRHGSESK